MSRANLELNLGKRCNNRCVFCLDGNAPRESREWVPLERARGELQHAREQGADSVGLLGGEPTAHPQIREIVALAKELGFARIALATNALKLADEAFARALVHAGVTRFSISIHGHTAEIEDALSGRAGNHARKLRAIDHLLALRREGHLPDNVSLNPVLTARNLDSMLAFVVAFRRRGIDDVRYNLVRTDACPDRAEELTPALPAVREQVLHTVAVNRRMLRIHLSFGDLPLCAYPWEVLDDGELARATVGELRDLDTSVAVFGAPRDEERGAARFVWRERKRSALKLQPDEVCRHCRVRDVCEGLWRSTHDLCGVAGLQPVRTRPRWMGSVAGP